MASPPVKARLARLFARVRRVSAVVRRGLVVALVVLVYVLVLPCFALGLRLRGRRLSGFRPRRDAAIGSLERLRLPY